MKRQRGQSAVEFALMAPIVFGIIFAMIYGGIMFMDYLNYNNYARTIAREVSLASADKRSEIIQKYNGWQNEDYARSGVYRVKINVDIESLDKNKENEDVVVTIEFRRKESFLVLPSEFDIVYRMSLEPPSTGEENTT